MGGGEAARSAGLLATARSLAVDAVSAEVATALRDAGIPSILLKGPTIATWLYDDGQARYYMDSDLLVPPAQLEAAQEVLRSLGFAPRPSPVPDPVREPPHSSPWFRQRDCAEVDLHRTLFGLGVAPEDAWPRVALTAETTRVGGADVQILDAPGRALMVALHAAQHGEEKAKPIEDLRRALDRAPESLWRDAAVLAAELHAAQSLATGLRLLPEGAELAARLGLADAALIDSATRPGSPAALALGIDRLVSTPGLGRKLGIAAREVVPPPAFMRWWSPLARRGPAGLAASYVWRMVWLVWRIGPSLRAWRRSRRASAAGR